MKKLLKFLVFFFLIFQTTFAHPLDISSSFLSFNKNYLNVTTYFHSYEIEYLLNLNNIKFKSTYDYYDHKDIIEKYLKQNIKLEIENNKCEIENFDLLELEEYQILSTWVEINYNFKCEKDIKKWNLKISFFNNFPLQTNQTTFYDLNKNSSIPFENAVLTSKIQDYEFDLDNKNKKCVVDTDWDWISDDKELIYKTDLTKVDTDWDFYTDYEEIFNSWSPFDNNFWPLQSPREEIPKDVLKKIEQNKKTKEDCEKEISLNNKISKDKWLLTSWFWNEYFIWTMEKISNYVNKTSQINIFYILLIVVWLWFVHAMWPWHSKSLLISYILDKNKNFFDGFLYIIIFTITHLLDIVLLFLVTKIVFNFYDISNYMLYIQRISLIILLLFSIYLIIRAILWIKHKKEHNCFKEKTDNKKDIKGSIMLWFISWLAPCTFGWSIFLLLFSTWSLALILPMLLALWLWIFLCLLFVLILTFILRKKIFEKLNFFSLYSSLFSSILLLILSIYLFSYIY